MQKDLFVEFDSFTKKGFDTLYTVLDKLIPMKPSHKKELPYACKDLSEYLTTDRDFLSRPYWTSPRLLSAYFHYFMVWNLVRLTKLFPSLNLGEVPQKCTFVDLGSGPLTLPLALWLSRSDLRNKEITFICCDIAPQPLQIGKKLFEELKNALAPNCPWVIQTVKTPNHKALRQLHERPFLITMGNVLNEGDEKKKHSAYEQISQIFQDASIILDEKGKIFAVEPGTRQGARMIQILRNLVTEQIEEDEESDDFDNENEFFIEDAPFKIISPCPCDITCPLTDKRMNKQNAWCHFNAKATYIPKELKQLSQKAGLDKDSISLSYLYIAKKEEAQKLLKQEKSKNKARIISDAFVLPSFKGRARYACHDKGLLLILNSARLSIGSLCDVDFPLKEERDLKSKALLAWLNDESIKSIHELKEKRNSGVNEDNNIIIKARKKGFVKGKNKKNLT